MIFAHDTEVTLLAAVTLANRHDVLGVASDHLQTVAELDVFFTRFEYAGRHDGDDAELESVRALRPRIRALLTSDRDTAVGLINTLLAEAQALPQLVRHDRLDWHLHAVATSEPLPTRIMVETAMAMIDVVRADEMSRLGLCADHVCEDIVLDLSRNRSRRFCSTTCANRNAVAAYRTRRASEGRASATEGSGAP